MMYVAESQLLIRSLEIAEMGFLFNMRRGVLFGLSIQQLLFYVYTISEGTGENLVCVRCLRMR